MPPIIRPGAVNVGVNHIPFPLQNPVGSAIQTPDGIVMLVAGGIDPLTAAAVQIAAGLAPAARWPTEEWSDGPTAPEVAQKVAQHAVALAMEVFKACHTAQSQMATENQPTP